VPQSVNRQHTVRGIVRHDLFIRAKDRHHGFDLRFRVDGADEPPDVRADPCLDYGDPVISIRWRLKGRVLEEAPNRALAAFPAVAGMTIGALCA
jgi:hypothetical protein